MQDILGWLDWERVQFMLLDFLPKLGVAIIIMLLFWLFYRITRTPIILMLRRAGFAQALIHLLVNNLYKFIIFGLGLVMSISQLGVNIATALAGIGVLGIAIGFAAQETLANVIAGFLIFWDRPFEVGHFIETQDEYGEVRDITMRTTRIRTPENTFVVIPNTKIMGELLINHSMYGETRVDVPVRIAYKHRISDAREALLAAVRDLDGVLKEPPPSVVVKELGDSSVNLEVRVWIANSARERPTFFRTLEAAKDALDEAGIEMPFPHRQLILDNVEDRVWKGAARFRGESEE